MVIFIVFLIVLSAFVIYYVITSKSTAGPTTTESPTQNRIKQSIEDENDKIQHLRYFCLKDKGYHVIVWPKDYNHFDMVRFNIAGIEYRDNIDEYLGESVGSLKSEPTNPYDPNAIKILAHDGHHVGYVPKGMTAEVRKAANLPCTCFFYIGKRNGIYFSDCFISCNYADKPNVSPL